MVAKKRRSKKRSHAKKKNPAHAHKRRHKRHHAAHAAAPHKRRRRHNPARKHHHARRRRRHHRNPGSFLMTAVTGILAGGAAGLVADLAVGALNKHVSLPGYAAPALKGVLAVGSAYLLRKHPVMAIGVGAGIAAPTLIDIGHQVLPAGIGDAVDLTSPTQSARGNVLALDSDPDAADPLYALGDGDDDPDDMLEAIEAIEAIQ